MNQHVFVTGATGLVGSHLLYHLLKKGYKVVALKRHSSNLEDVKEVFSFYGDEVNLWERIVWAEGDILDKDSFSEFITNCEIVFHCAAVVSFSGKDAQELNSVNLQGTENIASLCFTKNIRLCYVSSIGALGDVEDNSIRIDENTPFLNHRIRSAYSISKKQSEDIVWKFIERGLEAVIVNPSVILGAGHWQKSSSKLFSTIAKGMPFYTYGINGYIDVRDVCQLMILLAGEKNISGERFVLNGFNCSYKELFSTIARTVNKKPPFFGLSPWMTECAWRILSMTGKLTGKTPAFTKETASSSQHTAIYSSDKICSRFQNYSFYSLDETIHAIGEAFSIHNS